jgi:hypothetical protein
LYALGFSLKYSKKELGMSYQNQSDSDNLEIIVGPPGQESLINSIHNYAASNEVTIDKAWSRCVGKMADHFMKPKADGINIFSEIFSDLLEQNVEVSDYFLGHAYHLFSTNGQLLNRIKNVADRHEYTAPTLNFKSKNILDNTGKPINIRQFDKLHREMVQNYMLYVWKDVSWIHVTISYDYTPREKAQ